MRAAYVNALMTQMREDSKRIAASNRDIAASNRELGKTLEENSKREVSARDRVDITLREYEEMKNKIASLSRDNSYYKSLLAKMNFPFELDIIPESIDCLWSERLTPLDLDRKAVCRLEFTSRLPYGEVLRSI